MQTIRNFQARQRSARMNPAASQIWRNRPAAFYAIRYAAKHIRKPAGMSKQAYKRAKVAERNDMHMQMDEIRAANVCRVDSADSCWFWELATLARRSEFRPLFPLSLAEAEIAAQIAAAEDTLFFAQCLLELSFPRNAAFNEE